MADVAVLNTADTTSEVNTQGGSVEKIHQCGPWCSKIEDEQIVRMKDQVTIMKDGVFIRTSSPYSVPFALGWLRAEYHYTSPCGAKIYDLKHILKHLIKTKSKLSIKQFTFNNDFTYISLPLNIDDKVICHDVSNGREPINIKCINNHDDEVIDPNFEYVTKNIYPPEINLEPRAFRSSCDCEDDCKNVLKCHCRHLTDEAEDLGQLQGLLDSKFFAGYQGIEKVLPRPYVFGLYECNSSCGCSSKCYNRLVQNGMPNQLEIFRTEDRGWGVRCRHDLQAGEFVATYSGEVISYPEGERRGTENDEYFTKINLIEIVEKKEGFEETVREMDDIVDGTSIQALKESEPSEETEESKSVLSDVSCSSSSSSSSSEIEFVYMRDKNKRIIQKGEPKGHPHKKLCVKNVTSKSEWKDIDRFVPVRKYIAENTIANGNSEDAQKDINRESKESPLDKLPDKESLPSQESTNAEDNLDAFRYLLDAKRKGNVGRFLNHSCKPNCYLQVIFTDSHDPRMYQMAFFTTQKITAMTELTWNYMYQKDDKDKFVCLCDACKQEEKQ